MTNGFKELEQWYHERNRKPGWFKKLAWVTVVTYALILIGFLFIMLGGCSMNPRVETRLYNIEMEAGLIREATQKIEAHTRATADTITDEAIQAERAENLKNIKAPADPEKVPDEEDGFTKYATIIIGLILSGIGIYAPRMANKSQIKALAEMGAKK